MRVEELLNRKLGRYEVKRMVGRGGMAAVFEAYDTMLRRPVALKVLYPQLMIDDTLVERFREEAVTAARLDHPNIVPIYDVGEHDGFVYLAMKMLPGRSLQDMLAIDSTLSLEETIAFTREIAGALDYAHNRKVIHRDIKPGNIMIDSDGHAVLSDFGIAKSLDAPGMTTTGVLVGTPDYMAPEQIKSSLGPLDGRADIYALGVLVYRVLTGKRPFEGSTMQMLYGHIHEAPPPPSQVNQQLLPAVDAVLQRALAKHPDDRYQTAGEFAKALEEAAGSATTAGHVAPSPAISRRARQAQATTVPPPTGARPQAQDAARLPSEKKTIDLPEVVERKTLPLPTQRRGLVLPAVLLLVVLVGVTLFAVAKGLAGGQRDDETPVAAGSGSPTATLTARAATLTPTSKTPDAIVAVVGSATPTDTATPEVPTNTLEPSATAEPEPVRPTARPTTARPRPTTPRPTARPTDPPTPTSTEEPTPIPPTLTPCPVEMKSGFKKLWEQNAVVRAQLGCPRTEEIPSQMAIQYFDGGVLLWTEYQDSVYSFTPNSTEGTWLLHNLDAYPQADVGYTCEEGRYRPTRGFSRLLAGNTRLAEQLGYCGRHPEEAIDGAIQFFRGGNNTATMIYTAPSNYLPDDLIWVMPGTGHFTRYHDPTK